MMLQVKSGVFLSYIQTQRAHAGRMALPQTHHPAPMQPLLLVANNSHLAQTIDSRFMIYALQGRWLVPDLV